VRIGQSVELHTKWGFLFSFVFFSTVAFYDTSYDFFTFLLGGMLVC
jgi:hypothetical protein